MGLQSRDRKEKGELDRKGTVRGQARQQNVVTWNEKATQTKRHRKDTDTYKSRQIHRNEWQENINEWETRLGNQSQYFLTEYVDACL